MISVPTLDDFGQMDDRLRVLEQREIQREERHERSMSGEEMVEAAIDFWHGPWAHYVIEAFGQYEHDGYYNAKDEEVHIFDTIREDYGLTAALDFRKAYPPSVQAVVTRFFMSDHEWARPPKSATDRCVTKIRACKADPILVQRYAATSPECWGWLKEWCDKNAKARARREKAKANESA